MKIRQLLPVGLKNSLKKILFLLQPQVHKMTLQQREQRLSQLWENRTHTKLDLKHPVTFTQKLQWMKLYCDHPDMTRCVDKCEFKKYIAERIGEGYTAKLLREYASPKGFSLEGLPNQFVLKSNCQSDGKYIIIVRDKSKADLKAIEKEVKKNWFKPRNLLINSYCKAYYDVQPKVLAEEYLEQFDGQLNDYKIFCFDGEPAFIYVATEHFDDGENATEYPISFFTLDWEWLDVRYGSHRPYQEAQKPYHLEQMIAIAKQLAKDFPFVRVDFFDTPGQLYLAELTFYPGGGWTPYYPASFDEKMGNMLDLTKYGKQN